MKILNMGLPEIVLVLVIMLIFLGPKGMRDNAKSLAKTVRRVTRSETWQNFRGIYRDIKDYPEQLMKLAELDELRESLDRELNGTDDGRK